jgi:hypothetical protein
MEPEETVGAHQKNKKMAGTLQLTVRHCIVSTSVFPTCFHDCGKRHEKRTGRNVSTMFEE